MSANLAVQTTDAVHRTATANGQIGHVEALPMIIGICPAQGHQVIEIDTQFVFGVLAKKLFH